MKPSWLIYAGAVLALGGAFAQNYKGADEVLKQLAEIAGIEPDPKEKEVNAATLLYGELKAFQKDAAKLSPDEAATKWLALFQAYFTIPQDVLYDQGGHWNDRLSIRSLIESLPPTSSWDALLAKAEEQAKTDPGLKAQSTSLLINVLAGTPESRKTSLEELKKSIQDLRDQQSYMKQHLELLLKQVESAVIMRGGSSSDKIQYLEETLAHHEKADQNMRNSGMPITIPDLVAIAGEEKAKALLVGVLKTSLAPTFENVKTRKLAVKLALENVDAITKPHWDLIRDTDDVPLFEALDKKFPNKDDNQWAYKSAEQVYWVSLIINGRIEEAVKLTEQSYAHDTSAGHYANMAVLEMLHQGGYGEQVLTFVKDVLDRKPELSLWSFYIELSAHQSASPEALEFLEATLKKEDLSAKARKEIQPYYYKALLAADKVDAAVAVIQSLLQSGLESKEPEKKQGASNAILNQLKNLDLPFIHQSSGSPRDRSRDIQEHQTLCVQLMQIGHLLKKPDLFEQGLKSLTDGYAKLRPEEKAQTGYPEEIILLLSKNERGPEAEALLIEVLSDQIKGQDKDSDNYATFDSTTQLESLAWLYKKAGRPADVIKLLDESPYWAAPDLIYVSASTPQDSLNVIVASALLSLGEKGRAEEIVSYLLKESPSDDRVYELLLSLGGDQIEARLDAVFANDRFEERPLIWKAKLQLNQGRVDEAEKTIRAAIAIDPSDGEQGKGDRMRAYSVLADVLDKKGDKEQADIMRGAVKAIRLSEDADDWWSAGMLSRAVEMYEKSLQLFADAYCIQSRLALRYSEMGEFEKAEVHYRRAYELMPDSFGRIESHCFGCEGAFRGQRAQNIADKVFTKLAEEQPNKAQVFYLLGYLRTSQQRSEEAADYYRKAVKLDPDYLNAWSKLRGLSASVSMSSDERDEITAQLFRLDPRGKHGSHSFDHMTNLRKLWDMLLAADSKIDRQSPVTSLYELPASKAELLRKNPEIVFEEQFTVDDPNPNLRGAFASHTLVIAVSSFAETVGRSR